MSNSKKPTGRRRPGKNTFTTKSGSTIKLNRSLTERLKANRDARARRRAAYMSTLPKNRFKRILYRLQPKELAHYWFSRDGAIMALKITGIGIVVCFVLVVGVFAYFRKDLPKINDISGQTLGGSNTYYDRTGTVMLWQDYKAFKRQPVTADKMSPYVRDAMVAIEDKDYYKHGAFDVRGIVRAGVNNLLNRGSVQGGSTISQQLVKIDQGWAQQRTVGNKIKEVILAVEMEREYSKEDILTGYLNAVPFGPVAVGVQVASQDYFGIDAKDLNIAQAAMLTAIPNAPSLYSPYGPRFDAPSLIARQRHIINQMVAQKMITKAQGDEAKAVDILAQVKPQTPSLYTGIKAPYFVLAARDELQTRFTEKTVQRGGWKIITTVDMNLQNLAEKKVADALPIVRNQKGDSAAFVAIDNKTGQVVSLVGGADFNNEEYGKLNFGHNVRVSPGSTFKPYDYATFIDNNNAGAGSVFYDQKGAIPGYPCTNDKRPKDGGNCLFDYDFRFPGPLTIRYALGGSRNIPAVKAMLSAVPNDTSSGRVASINKTIGTAKAMMGNPEGYACFQQGVDVFTATKDQETQCYGSSAIGDGAYLHLDDHATGLSTIARGGQQIPHTYILKITDSAGKIIDEFKQPQGKQAIKADTAYIMSDMLSDPNASYLSRKFHRYKGWNFAVKTGTTNDAFDGLMASWSTQYTAVTWVGYHTRNKAMSGFMENMTTPIIRGWMEGAHDALLSSGVKATNWTRPSSIKVLPAFIVRTHVGVSSVEPSSGTDVFPSWYNPPKGGSGSRQTLDLVSNKIATTCTPDLAKKTEGEGGDTNFSADVFVGAASSAPDASTTDDIHNCNDEKPVLSLNTPATCSSAATCIFNVTVSKGTHDLSGGTYTAAPAGTVALLVNGQVVETLSIPADSGGVWSHAFTYSPTTTGSATIEARAVDSVLYSGSQSNSVTFN